MKYQKPWEDVKNQVGKLKQRGLIINNEELALHYLQNISYYRLEGYWWPLQAEKNNHIFKPNSHFETVISIYNFDRELRLLIFDVIERIEIGFRTRLIYHLSREGSPWWFEDPSLFLNQQKHQETLASIDRELQQTREVFIKEHFKKYFQDKRRPPAWKTIEIASFGNISKLYGNLKPRVNSKNSIAKELGTINHTFLPSWLQSITQIRNICAHHARLWNRNLPGRPKLLPKPPNKWIINVPKASEHHKLYIHLACMKYLLNVISPENHFSERLSNLFNKYHMIDLGALGISSGWENEPLWVG